MFVGDIESVKAIPVKSKVTAQFMELIEMVLCIRKCLRWTAK